ncbi:hypothetical protein QBC34DRAFT_472114 [Podospora aff. communis PSN243]|uniref:Cyclochlorotine biosynthesis protein O n=1 Tax=Podospora aff. communis PSN243 TaxID=3040156 RepID=A0AAV9GE17_9PEZI|nr:hypothetical protein QBC34DRAFT_472114 [Podospora aff. communis PSN243]
MIWSALRSKPQYAALADSDELESPPPSGFVDKLSQHLRKKRQTIQYDRGVASLVIEALVFVFVIVASFFVGRGSLSLAECGRRLSTWSPALEAIEYHQTMFDGSFLAPSIYRGTPSPELDAAWEAISTEGEGIIRIHKSDLDRLNKSADADFVVGFQDNTDGVQVLLEVFHQLHCLNTLRKRTWPEYYPKPDTISEKLYRDHTDHCIEMLRIALMCFSDVTPITAKWITATHQEPDFSTLHTCRNFDKIRDFSRSHAERWGQ